MLQLLGEGRQDELEGFYRFLLTSVLTVRTELHPHIKPSAAVMGDPGLDGWMDERTDERKYEGCDDWIKDLKNKGIK